MLRWISILGGLLIMMGHHARSEALFYLSVDGSVVEANAAKESRIRREQLAEAALVNRTARQYLVALEEQNPLVA
jgi:hypothetical protein